MVLLADRATAERDGFRPRARIVSRVCAAGNPTLALMEVIPATVQAVQRAGLTLDDIDLFEINEAFAPVPLIWMNGGDVISADGKTATVNSPAAVAAIKFYTDFYKNGTSPDSTLQNDGVANRTLFIAKKVAMYQSGQFDIPPIQQGDATIKIGAFPMPHPDGKDTSAIISGWSYVIPKDAKNPDDAKKFLQHYVYDKGDWEAADNLVTTMGINAQTMPPGVAQQLKAHFIAGWAGYPIVGTKEQVVDGLATLSRAGFDGVILSWAKFVEQMREFQEVTYPLVVQAGLR